MPSTPPSALSTTSASSNATSASKSPPRAAARNASTTSHCAVRSASGTGADPRTRRPESVAKATRRAEVRGLPNVRFVVGDIHDQAPDGPYDAIIGRLVLMYLPDPAAALRTQAVSLRSRGVVAPIEFDLHSARSLPSTPLVAQALTWLREVFTRTGVDPSLGPRLWAVLRAAGLRPLGMIGVQPHFGPDDPDGAAILAGIVRTVLPLIERTGVATAAEVGPDTLEQRLSEELATAAAAFAHPALISAWGTAYQPR
jgi:SAM-dependent methyltransferase